MGKLSSGPDWTDVAMLMSAIGSLHGCAVGCLITADTQGHNGELQIDLIATFNPLPGSDGVKEVRATSRWPNVDSRDLSAWVYGGLYALDFQISEAYKQQFLPSVK